MNGIAVDSAGSAYIAGRTMSAVFPVTVGAFQTTSRGYFDGFVTKLSPSGGQLAYSTYLGGQYHDIVHGIAVDQSGSAYAAGQTTSPNFPVTPGAFQTNLESGTGFEGFVIGNTVPRRFGNDFRHRNPRPYRPG